MKKLKKYIKKYVPCWLIKVIYQVRAAFFFMCSDIKKIQAYLIGVPLHHNVGDHAIVIAEEQILKKHKIKYQKLSYKQAKWLFMFKNMFLSSKMLLFLCGGGNMGEQYFYEEELRRSVLRNYPNNRIIIFPQTIDYGTSERGKLEEEKSKEIYNNCTHLCIVAREEASYDIMKKLYPSCHVVITPDIVLNMRYKMDRFVRNGALLCLRSDVEKLINEGERKKIECETKKLFSEVTYTDTVMHYPINNKMRSPEVLKKLTEFAKAELVITDRLHGMIFAALTGTPCIVLGNYNHKVCGEYQWLREYPYIIFLQDISMFEGEINKFVKEICTREWSYQYHDERYYPLHDVIEQYLEEVR